MTLTVELRVHEIAREAMNSNRLRPLMVGMESRGASFKTYRVCLQAVLMAIRSGIATTPARFAMAAFSHDSLFDHQEVKVLFDNFSLKGGPVVEPVVPEPSTISLAGLAALAWLGVNRWHNRFVVGND
jgi:hypothetical protein